MNTRLKYVPLYFPSSRKHTCAGTEDDEFFSTLHYSLMLWSVPAEVCFLFLGNRSQSCKHYFQTFSYLFETCISLFILL